jgi:hypothetical protein
MAKFNVKTIKTKTAVTAKELPPGVKLSDTQYPKWSEKKPDNVIATLTFYKTERLGWIVTTLGIARARRPGTADRSYAVTLDGNVCRAGSGPHVLAEVTVYVRASRKVALQKFLDLHEQGLAAAGTIRDRIGSRRAEGQLRRARGETFWRWNS